MTKFIYVLASSFFAFICFVLIEIGWFNFTNSQSTGFIIFWLVIGEFIFKNKK